MNNILPIIPENNIQPLQPSGDVQHALRVIANRDGFYDDLEKQAARKVIEEKGSDDEKFMARKVDRKW